MHRVDPAASDSQSKCYGWHKPSECRFKQALYVIIAKERPHSGLKKAQKERRERAKWVEAENSEPESEQDYGVYSVKAKSPYPGSKRSRHRSRVFDHFTTSSIDHTARNLSASVHVETYSGEALKVLGKLHVKVEYGTQHATLPLYVVAGGGPSLLGRLWLKSI